MDGSTVFRAVVLLIAAFEVSENASTTVLRFYFHPPFGVSEPVGFVTRYSSYTSSRIYIRHRPIRRIENVFTI